MIRVFLVFIILTSFACKSQQKITLEDLSKKIGKNVILNYNENSTHALVIENVENTTNYSSKFLIVRLDDNTIVREGKIVRGYIKWVNATQLEVFEAPGIIKEGQSESDFKKIIDLSSTENF